TLIAPFERDCTIDRRRGRVETRTIEVSCGMNDYLAPTWPLLRQVARLTRSVTLRKTGKTTQEVVYLITDLTQVQASPRRLLDLVRGHWTIGAIRFAEMSEKLRDGEQGGENP